MVLKIKKEEHNSFSDGRNIIFTYNTWFYPLPKIPGEGRGGGKWNFAPYPVCQGTIRFE